MNSPLEIKKVEQMDASQKSILQDIVVFCVATFSFVLIDIYLPVPAVYQGFPTIIGSFLTVLVILRHRKRPLLDLGLKRPRSYKTMPVWVLSIFITTFLVAGGAQQVLTGFVDSEVDLSKFAALHQDITMLLLALASIWITAAFFEEVVFRGFLLGHLITLFGPGKVASTAAVFLHALLFAAMHSYQGTLGIITTGVVGLVFGFFFLMMKRNLWALIITHGLIDSLNAIHFYLVGVPNGG